MNQRISKSQKERFSRIEEREKISKTWTPERREKTRNRMLNGGAKYANSFTTSNKIEIRRKIMLEGGATYIRTFQKNPSKPQVQIFNLVSKICPYVYLNYPVYHLDRQTNIDIAIPKLEIAIEYDGAYWHQDRESDLERQKMLEEDGWKFIRYRGTMNSDPTPSLEKVFDDVLGVLK
jgi:hypothetical protein